MIIMGFKSKNKLQAWSFPILHLILNKDHSLVQPKVFYVLPTCFTCVTRITACTVQCWTAALEFSDVITELKNKQYQGFYVHV